MYCTLSYFTVLYHIISYCIILYCIISYCTVSYCIVLYCTLSYCTVLYHPVLYSIILYCTLSYCTVLYHTVLYSVISYCAASSLSISSFRNFSICRVMASCVVLSDFCLQIISMLGTRTWYGDVLINLSTVRIRLFNVECYLDILSCFFNWINQSVSEWECKWVTRIQDLILLFFIVCYAVCVLCCVFLSFTPYRGIWC